MDIARASIERRIVVLFICALLVVGGVQAYIDIGKLEDPTFTIKTALVTVSYPGATVREVEGEAVSRIEDAVQSMSEVKTIRSLCTEGAGTVYVDIKDQYTSENLPQVWNVLRQKITDIQSSLPTGCTVAVNNDYGDVFGQFYALTGDGYTMHELWEYAEFLKKELVLVHEVARVNILGEQSEGVYVEFSAARLSTMGLSAASIFDVLNQQNTISSLGKTFYGDYYVTINPIGGILSVKDIGELIIGGENGRLIRLNEVAKVRRDYIDPQSFMMSFNGTPALGIGIATVEGGNVVNMGEAVAKRLEELELQRPIGMELYPIYLQSKGVINSVNDFVVNLIESLVIVVGVLLIFMGLRSGLLIGIVLLLTIAGTLMIMNWQGIFLQQVSLAALIIALGSLVDNAIVVTEGMLIGVQRGASVIEAASDTVKSSLWSMFGGTLIAVLAFVPIGLSPDSTGEFCRSLLQVIGISMMLSWVTAVTITPVMGYFMLKPAASDDNSDPYDKPLFRLYRAFLEGCLKYRTATMIVVIAMFVLSIAGFMRLDKTFFPSSTASYFVADMWQRKGTSIAEQKRMTDIVSERLRSMPEIKNVSSFVGGGALRFTLTYSPPDSDSSFSELLVEVNEGVDVTAVLRETQRIIDEEMPGIIGVCKPFSKGSSMEPVIEARFYGDDPDTLRALAVQAREVIEDDPLHNCVRIDWREKVLTFRPNIRMDRMQAMGLTRPLINTAFQTTGTGAALGVYREGDRSLPIIMSLVPEERNKLETVLSFPIWAPALGRTVPLGSVISSLDVTFEDNIMRRRNRRRLITIQSDVQNGGNVDVMQNRIKNAVESIKLPVGYSFEWGGEAEQQAKAMDGMSSMFVPSLLIMFTIMLFLFNGFRQPAIIFASIPLILIGVSAGLTMTNMSVSFMAIIGVLSLVGMLAKNSIVLLDQVSDDFDAGKDKYMSIVNSGVSRLRPVAMSAFTTVLGMIPLIWDKMFGSMSVTIMGGLTVSTILTMVVIPVMTAIVYHVPSPDSGYDYDNDDSDNDDDGE